jgi:hypothetical protein
MSYKPSLLVERAWKTPPKCLENVLADRNFKRPSGPRLPTTLLRVTSLMLRPSLGAAWLFGPPVRLRAGPPAID